MQAFRDEIKSQIESTTFDSNLLVDPIINDTKLESIVINAHSKCFPIKFVKFNKYKHNISPWMTPDILKSIKFRDKLYDKWKKMFGFFSKPCLIRKQL